MCLKNWSMLGGKDVQERGGKIFRVKHVFIGMTGAGLDQGMETKTTNFVKDGKQIIKQNIHQKTI